MRSVVQVIDIEQLGRRVLEGAAAAFDAQSDALYLDLDDGARLVQTYGDWDGQPKLSIPLERRGVRLGVLHLGSRRSGLEYPEEERVVLQQVVDTSADAVWATTRFPRNVHAQEPGHRPSPV